MSDKDNLMETLKKSRPKAKESTIKMYTSNLLKLQKLLDTSDFKLLKKSDNVKDKISELHFTTQRNYFNAIIVYLMAISEKVEGDPLIEEYVELRDTLNKKYEEKYLVESEKVYPVSFNGKTKFTLNLSLDLNIQEIEKEVLSHEKTKSILNNNNPKKIIIVPGKIINIVI